MTPNIRSSTSEIRKFVRFFTNHLGLINRHLPNNNYTLQEARILYDIGHTKDCTSKLLATQLDINPGYLSRVLKRLEKIGLFERIKSEADGRLYYIYLTNKGKQVLEGLEKNSDDKVNKLIRHLSDDEQQQLIEYMKNIETLLLKYSALEQERGGSGHMQEDRIRFGELS